ncbi:MAG: hypothetical protein QWI36_02890 [Wolbachia endosymbiont of Tyrophagus putrescentiae]|nr:hypothetical protein [Wolbachia endosymbiont of Tyrophagus putrescentiae]
MARELEKLIQTVGRGNLLESLFIFLGGFQNSCSSGSRIDHRNHINLSEFVKKEKSEWLDHYFNLQFSLQGLCLVFARAYKTLQENKNSQENKDLSTEEVIEQIYQDVLKNKEMEKMLGEIIDRTQGESDKRLKLLNILSNPKGKAIFENEHDFEEKVVKKTRELLNINYNNNIDKEFNIYEKVIELYYSIHIPKLKKDVALLILIGSGYIKLSEENKKKISVKSINWLLMTDLVRMLRSIEIHNENGSIKYTLDSQHIGSLHHIRNMRLSECFTPKKIKSPLKALLKNPDSDKFEEMLKKDDNIILNGSVLNSREKKENKIAYKIILGTCALCTTLVAVDYFCLEGRLIMNTLLQNDITTNLAILTLTVVIVPAAFYLSSSSELSLPPKSEMNGLVITNGQYGSIQKG